MVSHHYRDRLRQTLATADDESLAGAALNWSSHASLLERVSDSIRSSRKKVESEIDGRTGAAMVAKFNAISDKLDLDAADMRKGAGAIGVAQSAALAATRTHHSIMLSSGLNQMPTRPQGPTPGTQPTPTHETAMGRYNAQVVAYEQNEQRYEEMAREALRAMEADYAASTQVMKEIHGEPDPVEPPVPTAPGGSGGGDGGMPPTGPVGPPGTPGNPDPRDPQGPRGPGLPQPDGQGFPPDPDGPRTPTSTTPTTPPGHPPHTPAHVTPYTPGGATVAGGTDGGFDYSPTSSGGTGPSAPPTAGGGGISGAGMAAGGLAGGAAGAAGMRGSAPSAPLRSAGVKGIGATTRPSAPGSLSRGASAGSTGGGSRGAAGAKGAAGGARTGAAAGSRSGAGTTGAKGATPRGAAGRSGATTGKSPAGGAGQGKGKGLFRRGGNGSVTGARGGRRNDEHTDQREALVYEQDWLGDESAGTGVLD